MGGSEYICQATMSCCSYRRCLTTPLLTFRPNQNSHRDPYRLRMASIRRKLLCGGPRVAIAGQTWCLKSASRLPCLSNESGSSSRRMKRESNPVVRESHSTLHYAYIISIHRKQENFPKLLNARMQLVPLPGTPILLLRVAGRGDRQCPSRLAA